MRLGRVFAISGIFLAVTTMGGLAQGVPVKGEALAREWCARCHDVEKNGPFKQHPPSFASISVFRSEDQIYARIAYPPLHSAMPELSYALTPDNMQDLQAYIVSLEPAE